MADARRRARRGGQGIRRLSGRPTVAAPPAAAVGRFLDDAVAALSTTSSRPPVTRDLTIGGGRGNAVTLRMCFAPALLRLLPALERHGREPHGAADVELFAAAGPGLPAPPWSADDYLQPSGELRGCTEGRFLATYGMEGRSFNVFDRERAIGAFVCADPDDLPSWEYGAPLRHLLNWALADRGWHVVHAATAGDRGGAALLVGRGGSGKSTATFACLHAGLLSVGDDYCAVRAAADPPVAHALFDTGKLAPDSLARFPEAGGALRAVAPERTKAHLSLSAAYPRGVVDRLPLAAIVLVQVATGTGAPAAATPPQALRALAPSTLLQLRGTRAGALAAMGRLTRRLPAWTLPVGPDIDAIPAALTDLLSGTRAAGAL